MEGKRRHILEEYTKLQRLEAQKKIHVVETQVLSCLAGAGGRGMLESVDQMRHTAHRHLPCAAKAKCLGLACRAISA